jgi:hypothetical protein
MTFGIARIIFHVEKRFERLGIALFIAQKSPDGEHIAYMKTATFQEQDRSVMPDADPLFVDQIDAQSLMDQLWNAGIRPTDSRDKSDVINAKDRHIDSMREVVDGLFSLLEAKKR